MTTAARPTFETARGGSGKGENDLSKLSKQYSSRDLPGHTKLKYREQGQETAEELKGKDFKRALDDRERSSRDRRSGRDASSSSSAKKPRLDQITASANMDGDDPLDEEDEDSDSDDEDDTAELMAELNRIKKERAEEKAIVDAEKRAEDERIRTENILAGNPLLSGGPGSVAGTVAAGSGDFKVKRRWDDDVVFKNCAKGIEERSQKADATFINDTLRSEFHRKFMSKYIK